MSKITTRTCKLNVEGRCLLKASCDSVRSSRHVDDYRVTLPCKYGKLPNTISEMSTCSIDTEKSPGCGWPMEIGSELQLVVIDCPS